MCVCVCVCVNIFWWTQTKIFRKIINLCESIRARLTLPLKLTPQKPHKAKTTAIHMTSVDESKSFETKRQVCVKKYWYFKRSKKSLTYKQRLYWKCSSYKAPLPSNRHPWVHALTMWCKRVMKLSRELPRKHRGPSFLARVALFVYDVINIHFERHKFIFRLR